MFSKIIDKTRADARSSIEPIMFLIKV